ncbi:hypothetical protein GIB67_027770 [Kingdonia uniflora]|uniref:Uncharacterized protein n=1 Tax=Kingdonia uniflora TaxID=39325 RepID=A0A7J7PCD7_9MAGN|nr:hypothetical protein GIB67_027770 [Kingdonia uniflora]
MHESVPTRLAETYASYKAQADVHRRQRIGENAYELDIPRHMRRSPVVNVSLLSPFVGNHVPPITVPIPLSHQRGKPCSKFVATGGATKIALKSLAPEYALDTQERLEKEREIKRVRAELIAKAREEDSLA